MKLAVPTLADAWSGQLLAAGLPLVDVYARVVGMVVIAVILWRGAGAWSSDLKALFRRLNTGWLFCPENT